VRSIPKAILFDLDGTLLWSGERGTVLRQVAWASAGDLPGKPDTIAAEVEAVLSRFWADPEQNRLGRMDVATAEARVIVAALATAGVEPGEVASRFAEAYVDARMRLTRLAEGATATLESLRRLDVRMAIVTNGDGARQRSKIERFGLRNYFDHLQIEGEAGFGKPDPRAYLVPMRVLGALPAETVVVGDNLDREVAAPQKLGLRTVWLDKRGKGLPPDAAARPDLIIRSLPELLN